MQDGHCPSCFLRIGGHRKKHCDLYESPVMSVIEGTGFHPFVVPARRDGGYHQSSAAAIYPQQHCVGWALPNTKQTIQDMV
jgi:hypothetical protein